MGLKVNLRGVREPPVNLFIARFTILDCMPITSYASAVNLVNLVRLATMWAESSPTVRFCLPGLACGRINPATKVHEVHWPAGSIRQATG